MDFNLEVIILFHEKEFKTPGRNQEPLGTTYL